MKRLLLAGLAIAVLPLAAQAGDLSYTYLQAGYDYTNSSSGFNSHGWSGDGSFAIGPNFFVTGGGSHTNTDSTDKTTDGWNLGGGFHAPIGRNTDFVGNIGYHRSDVSGMGGDVTGWSGDVGVRSALAPHFEGWVKAGYSNTRNDLGDIDRSSDGKAFGTIGGQYKFNKNWGLVGEARFSPGGNQGLFVGPRVSF